MARYIIISTLTDEGAKTLKKNPDRVKKVNSELKDMGVNVLDQYVVLGDFDFLSIVEADDVSAITKVVVELLSRGSIRTVTYRVIPVNEFIESLKWKDFEQLCGSVYSNNFLNKKIRGKPETTWNRWRDR